MGDLGSIPGSGRFPGEGNGNPFQYSCLENPMDGGTWWATVHGVAKSDTTEQHHFHFQGLPATGLQVKSWLKKTSNKHLHRKNKYIYKSI